MAFAFLLFVTYLLAAAPFGLVLGVVWGGVDVRRVGSGNIGATNVARNLGWRLGAVTLGLDALKGLLPVALASLWFEGAALGWVGLTAVVAHCYPVYLEFRGGKGVATAAGVLAVLAPWATLGAFAIWGAVFGLTRKSSLAALSALVSVQGLIWWLHPPWWWLGLLLAVLLGWRHKDNIRRLRGGTEASF